MLKAVRFLLLMGGLGLALYLVSEHAAAVTGALRGVGWGFAGFMAASFLVYALDTWGWRLVFAPSQPEVGFWRLFSIRMAGEAVNKITPLASMGGEPLKAFLLTRCGARSADALASVAVAKNTMTQAQIAFIFFGVLLAIAVLPGRGWMLAGFAAFPGVILGAMLVTAVVDFRLRRTRAVKEGDRTRAAPPYPGSKQGKWRRAIIALWAQVADFFWANPRAFFLSLLLFFLGWAAGALELLAAAHALGFDLSLRSALALEGLLVSVNMATFFIPANAGSQEGGLAFLFQLLGVGTPHGVAVAVLRRCRDLIWVVFGLAYLAVTEGRVLVRPTFAGTEPGA